LENPSKVEPIHRVKEAKVKIAARRTPILLEEFVEEKLHYEEGRSQVEPIVTEHDLRISAADDRIFFEDLDLKTSPGEKHSSSQASWTCTDDRYTLRCHLLILSDTSPPFSFQRQWL
jgi:hypothetical protein